MQGEPCIVLTLLDHSHILHPSSGIRGPACVDSFCSLLPQTCDTEVLQKGLLILFLFIILSFFRQAIASSFKKMPFFCGCDPGAPLLVSTKAATCSGACQIPQQLVNLS